MVSAYLLARLLLKEAAELIGELLIVGAHLGWVLAELLLNGIDSYKTCQSKSSSCVETLSPLTLVEVVLLWLAGVLLVVHDGGEGLMSLTEFER